MQQFLAVIEKAPDNYGAFLPDIPGCVSTGKTLDETLHNIREALEFHLEGIALEGLDLPVPQSLQHHFSAGTFEEGQISRDYVIATISVAGQRQAA